MNGFGRSRQSDQKDPGRVVGCGSGWRFLTGITVLVSGLAVGANAPVPSSGPSNQATVKQSDRPAGKVIGFVVSYFAPSIYNDPGNCPEGLAGTLRENYLSTLDASERSRLLIKQNEAELSQRWKAYATGPADTNICSQPELFDRPPQKMVRGRTARGLDLDADVPDGAGCAHEEFVDPDGHGGIDNQAWRAMGCWPTLRGEDGNGGEVITNAGQRLISGEDSQVLVISGIDSFVDDEDVQIVYANTNDRAIVDSRRNFLPNSTYNVTPNTRYRNVLRGKIKNGVLSSEPSRLLLKQTWGQGGSRDIRGSRTAYDLNRARLQLTFQPDGTLRGLVGGYQPIWNVIAPQSLGGLGSAVVGGIDCAAQYKALQLMADGDRDSRTGTCRTISSAYDLTAVPAFVNDIVRLPD